MLLLETKNEIDVNITLKKNITSTFRNICFLQMKQKFFLEVKNNTDTSTNANARTLKISQLSNPIAKSLRAYS